MSTTQRDLLLRRRTLWIITAVATAMMMWAYWGVHGPTLPMRRASAPAVLAVDTARGAMLAAQDDAHAGPAGEDDFQNQISVAGQSLSQAAIANVTGLSGRQTLQTLTGLVVAYTGWVEKAQGQPDDSVLRKAYLGYATSVLTGPDTGIVPRLDSLQKDQLAEVADQASFDVTQWVSWGVAVLLCVVLLVRLVEAQGYLRRRFRRRWNAWLLATMVLLAGCPALMVLSWETHFSMVDARTALLPQLSGANIRQTAALVNAYLRHTIWRSHAVWGIPVVGVCMALGIRGGFQARLNDYGNSPRRESS